MKEYFLFNLNQEYLDPPLQGYRLVDGQHVPIEADENGALESQELGLRLRLDEGDVQFYRLDTGERLLAPAERAAVEAERADHEAKARHVAEAELARLREELSRRPSA